MDVLFTPAEFATLPRLDLTSTCCVVFDVLRATSTMITALGNGAAAMIPVAEIAEALERRAANPNVLLAGERHGVRIRRDQTGSIDFDFGNSPREFTAERVSGRTVVITTTNGTRALRSCASAETVLIGSFLALGALAEWITVRKPEKLLILCSGTYEEAAFEDVLGAGALCDLLWPVYGKGAVSDSAQIARQIYRASANDLLASMKFARNGRRLLEMPDLRDDVPFCLQRDSLSIVAALNRQGCLERI